MRHNGPRAVAPLNSNPQWPEGYVAVLREAGAIEKAIPYHVAWVRGFFARFPIGGFPRHEPRWKFIMNSSGG